MARGGYRAGAGRPKTDTKAVMIRLTPSEHKKLSILGGSVFIKQILKETKMNAYQNIKLNLEASNLSAEAKDVVLTIIDQYEDDEEVTVREFIEALEDGECLASYGIDNEDAVDEAYDFLEEVERRIENDPAA